MTRVCVVCKKNIIGGYCHVSEGVTHTDRCFTAYFWKEKIDCMKAGDITEDRHVVLRVKGEHYIVEPDDAHGLEGCGGQLFYFRINLGPHAGVILRTTNLWSQGKYPEWTQLTDNAEPITERQALDIGNIMMVRESDEFGEEYLVPYEKEESGN